MRSQITKSALPAAPLYLGGHLGALWKLPGAQRTIQVSISQQFFCW